MVSQKLKTAFRSYVRGLSSGSYLRWSNFEGSCGVQLEWEEWAELMASVADEFTIEEQGHDKWNVTRKEES